MATGKTEDTSPEAPIAARSAHDADIDRAIRRATDIGPDPWAVLQAIRDRGRAVDARLLYGNDAYWAMTRFDRETAVGQPLSALIPGLDWGRGFAARIIHALRTGRDIVDRHARLELQSGIHAGTVRAFELEMTVADDLLALGFRDVTDDGTARERQAAEARRTAAVARFLSAAVDPNLSRRDLLGTLAAELAATLGDLCAILEILPDDGVRVAAVAGGPGDVADQIRSTHVGVSRPPSAVAKGYDNQSILMPTISPEHRAAMVVGNAQFGLPAELGAQISSLILAPIRSGGRAVGRIHLERFGDAPGYGPDDLATVDALAAAAALILERRSAEAGRAASLARFEALFEQAPVPMVFGGPDGLRFNVAACALFDRPLAELQAHALDAESPWIPSDEIESYARLRESFVAREPIDRARFTIVRPTGERRDVVGSAIPLNDAEGESVGVVVLIVDLTEREELEAQLRHAQKMEALGRLAGGIAHDFNNVLMGILGYAEFLAADVRNGTPSVDDADQVIAATRRAIDLTARLTTFARRDVARQQIVEVDGVIRGIAPLLRRLAPESITIESRLEPSPPVTLDAAEFEQVIVNLVVNAVDAMPGGGRLSLEVKPVVLEEPIMAATTTLQAGPHVMVAVSDTGTGMDEATRQRIFEPFYTTKPIGEGTGLGLAMAFAAVERASGAIWVYSEPGRGSTFRIYLPPAGAAAAHGPGADAQPDPQTARGSETILVVEDDELVRDVLQRGLGDLGYRVLVAALPSEGLAIAEVEDVDVVVTDVVMPEMTGDRLAVLLRDGAAGLPIVFMTGYSDSVLSFDLGPGDALVSKPLTPLAVARAIRTMLDRDTIGS